MAAENKLTKLEKRVGIIENRLKIKKRKKVNPKGTDNPLLIVFGTLVVGWLPIILLFMGLIYRVFRVLFYMPRSEQRKRKWAYIKGKFNFLKYIMGGDSDGW